MSFSRLVFYFQRPQTFQLFQALLPLLPGVWCRHHGAGLFAGALGKLHEHHRVLAESLGLPGNTWTFRNRFPVVLQTIQSFWILLDVFGSNSCAPKMLCFVDCQREKHSVSLAS